MKAKESHQLKFGVTKSDHLRKDITKPRTRQGGTQCPGNYTSPDYQRCTHALTHNTFCTRQRLHFYFILLIFC